MGELVTLKFHAGGVFVGKDAEVKYVGGVVEERDNVDPDLIFVDGLKSIIEGDLGCPNVVKLHYKVSELPLSSGCRLLDSDESVRNLTTILVKERKVDIYSEHAIYLTDEEDVDVLEVDITSNNDLNTVKAEFDVDLEAVAADLEVEEVEQGNSVYAQDSNLVNVLLLTGVVGGCNSQNHINSRMRSGEGEIPNENNSESDSSDDEEGGYIVHDNEWLSDNDDCEVQEVRVLMVKNKQKAAVCLPSEEHPPNATEGDGALRGTSTEFEGAPRGTDTEGDGSDYFSSDEYGSHVDASDEETDHAIRVKSNHVYYQVTEDPRFQLEMMFESKEAAKEALTAYAVKNAKDYKLKKNDKGRLVATCKGSSCPWKISVIYDKYSNNWQVKTLVEQHSCNRTFINSRVTTKWLAEKYAGRIRASPGWKAREIKNTVKEELRVEVTEDKCRKAKMIVLKKLQDSFKEEYSRIWDYVEAIKSSNMHSSAYIQVRRENPNCAPTFRKLYMCFNACKQGFLAGCRKVIGLDGCFLKGLIKGELLSAVGRDANNQMYPIAWAVVEVESKESWTWFLQGLIRDLNMENGVGWTLVTDQQKGLVPSIGELLPRAEHRMCARHIYANFRKKYKSKHLQRCFWKCAKSTTIPYFEKALEELQKISREAAAHLGDPHPRHWCRAYFDTSVKCDVVDNNMSETFNAWILEARHKPIISMLEEIRVKVMKRICVKMNDVKKWETVHCPRILTKLEKMVMESSCCHLEWNGSNGFEIQHNGDRFVVNLANETCSCNGWNLSGIPCPHAICAIFHIQKQPQMYLHECYRKETYLKTYDIPLEPLDGPVLWPKTNLQQIVPPIPRKMPGRRRIKRRREEHEPATRTRMSRVGIQMTCKICKQVGHNRSGCPKRKSQENGKKSGESSQSVPIVRTNRVPQRGFGLFTSRTGVQIFNPGFPGEQVVRANCTQVSQASEASSSQQARTDQDISGAST